MSIAALFNIPQSPEQLAEWSRLRIADLEAEVKRAYAERDLELARVLSISATADALEAYLAKHPEYRAGEGGARRFLTTGKPGAQSTLVETFWGAPLSFERA